MKKTLCMLLCIGMAAAMCACSPGEKKAEEMCIRDRLQTL